MTKPRDEMTMSDREKAERFSLDLEKKYNQIELANMPIIISQEAFIAGIEYERKRTEDLRLAVEEYLKEMSLLATNFPKRQELREKVRDAIDKLLNRARQKQS